MHLYKYRGALHEFRVFPRNASVFRGENFALRCMQRFLRRVRAHEKSRCEAAGGRVSPIERERLAGDWLRPASQKESYSYVRRRRAFRFDVQDAHFCVSYCERKAA